MTAPRKIFEKSDVQFEHPAKGDDHCSECKHWTAAQRCEIVAGVIRAEDWCDQFLRRDTSMPAKSRAQQEAMAIAEHNPSQLNAKNKGLLQMSHSQLHDFASTKRKGLPEYAPDAKKKKKFSI